VKKKTIPESTFARAGVASATALRIGAKHLEYRAKRPFLSTTKQHAEKARIEDDNARLLFDALSRLRGTALKLAQALGMEMDLLPESYREQLENAYHRVPPLNRVLVRKVFEASFGQEPEQLFRYFDGDAFAAASLGQVHLAALPDKTRVAVKVQYPGIHVTLDSDINLMRKVVVHLKNGAILRQSLNEVHARLIEEVDYCKEAEHTQWFHDHLCVPGVSVPRVFKAYSSSRILTTSYCNGSHLDDWLAQNPSQAMRNRVGQLLYDVFMRSALQLRRLHADPNPGNYLFRDDGGVALIDFGCTKSLSNEFVDALPRLLRAYRNDDREALFAAYQTLGMEFPDHDLYDTVLRPFGQWLVRPFEEESFDFATNADYTQTARIVLRDLSNMPGVSRLAEDFVFFDRTLYGLYKIFERLGATVRMRHHWEWT